LCGRFNDWARVKTASIRSTHRKHLNSFIHRFQSDQFLRKVSSSKTQFKKITFSNVDWENPEDAVWAASPNAGAFWTTDAAPCPKGAVGPAAFAPNAVQPEGRRPSPTGAPRGAVGTVTPNWNGGGVAAALDAAAGADDEAKGLPGKSGTWAVGTVTPNWNGGGVAAALDAAAGADDEAEGLPGNVATTDGPAEGWNWLFMPIGALLWVLGAPKAKGTPTGAPEL
jgi:hypothetical protein